MDLYKTAGEAKHEVRSTGQTGVLADDTSPRMEQPRTALTPPAAASAPQPIQSPIERTTGLAALAEGSPTFTSLLQSKGSAGSTDPAVESKPMSPLESLAEGSPTFSELLSQRRKDPEPAPEPAANKDAGFLSDTGNLLGIGFNNLALNVLELVGRTPLVGDKLVKGLNAIDQWASGKDSEEILKGNVKQGQAKLSDAMTEAAKKDWWDAEKGTFGSAWADPRSYYSGIVQSLPEQTLTMFPPMRLAKGIYASKLAAGVGQKEAAAAAARAATLAGGVMEGTLAGAASSREVRDKVLAMTPDQLKDSQAFQMLVESGMNPEAARQELANNLATQAFITSGAITGAFGGMGDRILAKAVTEGVGKSVMGRVVKAGVGEGLLEEFPQEYGSAVAENLAMRRADPKVGVLDDAFNRGLGGLATGAIQGGAMGGAFGRKEGAPTKEVTDTDGNVTVRYNAETNPNPPDQGGGTTPAMESGARSTFVMEPREFKDAVASPEFMAAAYAQADDNMRAALQRAAPNLNLNELSQDEKLVSIGQEFINDTPQFFNSFTNRILQEDQKAQVDEPPFDPTDTADNPAPRFTPSRANLGVAQDLASQGIDEAEGVFTRQKPVPSNEDQTLVAGPEDTEQTNPDSSTLLDGYNREARNIEGTQDPARRRYLANQAMTSMIRNGFTFDDANAMFGQFLNQDQATIEAAPAPQETVGERLQTFNKIRKGLVDHDNKTWGVPSTEADYQVANLTPAIYKLADLFGVKVVGFKYTGKDAKLARRRGVSSPDGIAINVGSRDQMMTIFGHEVYHQLSKRDKKASKELEQRILAYISEDGQQALRTRLENIGYSPEKINEETVADIMGVMFQDPRFWQQLGAEKPNLLQKVLRVIDDMIRRFGQLGSRSEEIASYINEMDAVRDMMADFVSQSLDKQASFQEIEDSVEMSDDPVGQFQELAKAGRKVAAAKIFREAGFYKEYGVPFEQFYKEAQTEPTQQAAPAPEQEETVRLYRAESSKPAQAVAAWKKQDPSYIKQLDAQGRWFTDDLNEAQWYLDNEYANGDGKLTYVDVPKSQADAMRVSNMQKKDGGKDAADNPLAYSRRPEKEFFLPKDLAAKRKDLESSAPLAKKVEAPVQAESGNVKQVRPNTFQGTLSNEIKEPAKDVGTAPATSKQRAEQRQAKAAQARKTYSDGVARSIINQQLDPKGDKIVNPKLEYEFRVGDDVVGKVFSAGDQYYRFNIKQDGSYNYSTGKTLSSMIAKPPAGATLRRINDIPRQTAMDLEGNKQQVNKYTAEVQRIMTTAFTPSRVADTLAEMRAALDEQFANPFFKNGKDRSDVEYIFNMFADVGAISSDDVKSRNEEVDAIRQAIEQLQAQDTKSRAGLLKVHAGKIESALDDLSRTMAEDGMSQQQINEIVGPAQESLQSLEDATSVQDMEAGLDQRIRDLNKLEGADRQAEIKAIVAIKNSLKDEEVATTPRDEDTLGLPSKDFSEARQAAAAAVDEIVNGKQSPIAVIRRELNKPDRAFTFSDLRKEMAARGMDISEIDREVAQWPAAQYSLAYWVQKNAAVMSPYMARTTWFNSHENIMAIYKDEPALRGQYEAELSDVEKRFIDAMRKERQAIRDRRTQTLDEFGEEIADPKGAFPFALFNKYSLNDMRNIEESNISQDDQAVLRSLVGGNTTFLPRLWLDDVAFAVDARKDLRLQILEGMSKQERAAVEKYEEMSASALANNERISALRSYSTMLDEIGELDPAAYEAFKRQIIYSDLRSIPALLHRAQVVASEAAQAKDKKQLSDILSAYLERVYNDDELTSKALDETQGDYDAIQNRGKPEITEKDIDQYVAMMERQGALIDRDTAKNDLLYQAIAELSDTEGQRTFETPEESAASEVDQPENQVGLSGDIRYKRGRNSSGPAATMVQAHIAEITQSWKRKPNVQVFANVDQIADPDVRARLTERVESGAFKGAMDPNTGAIYIFSQHLDDIADAEFVLFHELYGHWGLRAFLGDKLNAFLENQYKLNKKVKAEADRQFNEAKEDGSPMSHLESVEEAISDMAVNGEPSLFRQLIGQLVTWLRKNNMSTIANWIDSSGTSELASVLAAARKVARTGEGISPFNGAPSDVMYARKRDEPVEVFASRDDKVTGYARIHPVTGYWTVFSIEKDGSYTAITVEEMQDVLDTLKKVGKVSRSKDRSTRDQNVDPANIHHIPDYKDLTGWEKFKRNFKMGITNSYLPIFEVARFLESKGIKSTIVNDIIKYEGRLGYFINQFEKTYAKPMERALKAAGDKGATLEDVDDFLMARHARERNDYIHTIDPKNRQGSGMSSKEAEDILHNMLSKPFAAELETIGKLTDGMSKDKLNYMLQTGLTTKLEYQRVSHYDHYVNLSGNAELNLDKYDKSSLGGKAFNLKGRDLLRSTGRGTKAVDVLQNTMNAYVATLMRGQKNVVVNALLRLLEQNLDATFVKINPLKERKQINVERLSLDKQILKVIGDADNENSGRALLKDLQKQIEDGAIDSDEALGELASRINQAERRRDIDPQTAIQAIRNLSEAVVVSGRLSPDGYITMVEDNSLMMDPNVLVAKAGGIPIVMQFEQRADEVLKAITGDGETPNGILKSFGAWNRFFSQMVTSWNPAWIPVNLVRDFQTAYANAAADPRVGAKLANQMAKNFIPMLRAAYRYTLSEQAELNDNNKLRAKLTKNPLSDADRNLIESFIKDGGNTFFLDRNDVEQSLDKLNRTLSGPKGVLQNTQAKLEGLIQFMERFSNPAEMAARLAIYKTLMDAGWSQSEASLYGKELTVNFNMKGNIGWLRSLFVFFNPAVQGTVRMFRDYSRSEKGVGKYLPSNQFAAVSAGFMALGMLSAMLARAIGGDDDELPGVSKFDQIPNFRRNTSFVIMPNVPGASIPIAYGWNVPMAAGSYLWDVINGYMKPEVAAMKMAGAAFDSFAPIGSGSDAKSTTSFIAKTVTPSALLPIVELALNENRYGAPIFKEKSPFEAVAQSNAYMHFETVNPISKGIAHSLAALTSDGNPRYKAGLLDINPAVLDHFVSGFLPGLPTEGLKFAGAIVNAIEGRNQKDMAIPFVDRFNAKPSQGFADGASRRVIAAIDTAYAELNATDTSAARKAEIMKEHPHLGQAKAIVTSVSNSLREISSDLKRMDTDPRFSDAQKVAFRNEMEDRKKAHVKRLVNAAIRAGFRDDVIDNKAEGFLGKVADRIRN